MPTVDWSWLADQGIVRNLVYSVAVIAALALARSFILGFLKRRLANRITYRLWRINTGYLAGLFLVLVLLPIWLPSLGGLAALIGLFGASILIVHKEILMNVSGWLYIMIRKPFEVGNRIGVTGLFGDVIDIRLLDFSLIETTDPKQGGQSTGRVLHIPNLVLLTNPVSNSSKEFAFNWNEIRVPLALTSDWKKAAALMEEVARGSFEGVSSDDERLRRSENLYSIKFNRVRPIVYVEYRGGAIVLTLRHLCEPKTRRHATDRFWRAFLDRVAAESDVVLLDRPEGPG